LRLLVIHFIVVSRHQQTRPLTSKCYNSPWSVAAKCIAPAAGTLHSTQWNHILVKNRDFCLPHLHSTLHQGGFRRRTIAMPFGMEKIEWCG